MIRATRRGLLGGMTAGAAALVAMRDPFAFAQAGAPAARGGAFGQGVASGQQTTSGITLWSRVDGLEREGRVQFEVSPDPDFRRVIHRQDALVTPRDGFTALQRIDDPRVLRPGEQYFYRCLTCDVDSSVGRFKTALPADSNEPVRIGFFSCQAWESGFYPAHTALAAEDDLDLVVCLGDYVYENGSEDPENEVRQDRTGGREAGDAQTLAEWREKYALYHSDASLIAVRQRFPLIAIWDDHEAENDYAGETPGTFAPSRRRVSFTERRANGYRTFFEHMPRIRVPGAPDQIYGRIGLGGMADVFLLDQRQYRSDQPTDPATGEGCQANPACRPEAEDPSRTHLGARQKAWLKDGLERSRAAWKVVGNQVMIMALDAPMGNPLNYDQWDGYAAERRELIAFLGERGIEDVTLITGDIHVFFAGDVAPDGRARPVASPSLATEFVGGSISSEGLADELGGDQGKEAVALPTDAQIEANNPHIKLANGSFKGYGVLDCRADEMLVTYRAVRSTRRPTSEAFDLARFRVARGEATVEVLDRADRPGP